MVDRTPEVCFMMYVLFTEGRVLLTNWLIPLLCSTPVLLIATSFLLGAGIRRTENEALTRRQWQWWALAGCTIVALTTVTTLCVVLLGDLAVQPARSRRVTNSLILFLTGAPPNVDPFRLFLFGALVIFADIVTLLSLHHMLRDGGWLRERTERLRHPRMRRGALGSSHFCTMREFRRFRRFDPDGLMLLGAFWSGDMRRLDFGAGRFCLSGEDAARGILTVGGPGSGKTQGVILPAIADRMQAGHSLIIADPQGELLPHVLRCAAVTRHLVVVHDPTSRDGTRYNLAAGITNVSDARAIAEVLVPTIAGDNRFWSDSAAALLAACLIRFDTLGDIFNAMSDLPLLVAQLESVNDDAALLANSFNASVHSDGKVAANIIATLATALTGWASADVRANTASSDFDADLLLQQPAVIVLTCPGRMRGVYASYLGATLRKLMLDLDTLAERAGGALPLPVGIILDEFPTLGKLDGLVADVNLVRKRRLSILIGAQTKGQFHLIYGRDGTQALFSGLATQIVFGGGDAETAEYYSTSSGTATMDANLDDPNSYLRQRPLLTVDEVITPQIGNCTIFARYVETGYAAQVILHARLTRFYERIDWKQKLDEAKHSEPLRLERGISLPQPTTAIRKRDTKLERAAEIAMAREAARIAAEQEKAQER